MTNQKTKLKLQRLFNICWFIQKVTNSVQRHCRIEFLFQNLKIGIPKLQLCSTCVPQWSMVPKRPTPTTSHSRATHEPPRAAPGGTTSHPRATHGPPRAGPPRANNVPICFRFVPADSFGLPKPYLKKQVAFLRFFNPKKSKENDQLFIYVIQKHRFALKSMTSIQK